MSEKEKILKQSLSRIADYEDPERLKENDYGLSYEECLQMAYENVLNEARHTLEELEKQND